jgi:hypothetical protein
MHAARYLISAIQYRCCAEPVDWGNRLPRSLQDRCRPQRSSLRAHNGKQSAQHANRTALAASDDPNDRLPEAGIIERP